MATLLTIAQRAARYTGFGDSQLSFIVGNPDVFAEKLYQIVDASGRRLSRVHDWTVLLVMDNTVTTVASTSEYAMPSDFDRLVRDANWDQTNNWKMRGAITTQEWRYRKDSVDVTNQLRKVFRKTGSSIEIHPTPDTSGETLTVPYISANWCQDSGSTGQSSWQADDDTPIIDEELLELDVRWRLLNGRAPYFEEKEEFERVLRERIAADLMYGKQTLGYPRPYDPSLQAYYNLPESSFPDS